MELDIKDWCYTCPMPPLNKHSAKISIINFVFSFFKSLGLKWHLSSEGIFRMAPLTYAQFHSTGVLQGAEWWNYIKISQQQADLTVFALDPWGASAPFASPHWYAGEDLHEICEKFENHTLNTIHQNRNSSPTCTKIVFVLIMEVDYVMWCSIHFS